MVSSPISPLCELCQSPFTKRFVCEKCGTYPLRLTIAIERFVGYHTKQMARKGDWTHQMYSLRVLFNEQDPISAVRPVILYHIFRLILHNRLAVCESSIYFPDKILQKVTDARLNLGIMTYKRMPKLLRTMERVFSPDNVVKIIKNKYNDE